MMEQYPEECIYKVRKDDGEHLQRKHHREYLKLLRERRAYLNEIDPLPGIREIEEPQVPGESKRLRRLVREMAKLSQRVKELERWRSQNDLDGLDEI